MSLRVAGLHVHLPLASLALLETGALLGATYVATWARNGAAMDFRPWWPQALIFTAATLMVMAALGLFARRQRARSAGLVLRISAAVVLGAIGSWIAVRIAGLGAMSIGHLALVAACALVLAALVRIGIGRMVNEQVFSRRVLVYGSGRQALAIAGLRRRSDQRGFTLVGFVQPDGEPVAVPAAQLLEPQSSLRDLVAEQEVDAVVVAMDDRRRSFPIASLLECRLAGVEVSELVSFLERETGAVRLDVLHPSWLIYGEGFRAGPIRRLSRRFLDLAASIGLLLLLWPVMLLTALAIKLEDGWRAPVLYRQTRIGLFGRRFEVLKFRSMRTDAESEGRPEWARVDDARVTAVGAVIRKVRIDELPQLLNVLWGDMSMVGPRPERPEFVESLSQSIPYYSERHWVKPGITGWAQLCYPYGASERDAAEKLQYDLYYVKHQSLLFDIVIMVQTAEVILLGKGAR